MFGSNSGKFDKSQNDSLSPQRETFPPISLEMTQIPQTNSVQ